MFCINCGASFLEENANYCSHCGQRRNDHHKSINKKTRLLSFLIPVGSFLSVLFVLILVYSHETEVNGNVITYQEKAEKAALAGEYNKALDFVETGLSYRNNYDILINEKELILTIIELNEDLTEVEQKIMDEQYESAQRDLDLLKRQMATNRSPLFVKLSHEIKQAETSVKVGEMKEEINKLESIDELADKLATFYSLELQEATELKQQIYTKMVTISSVKAEENLANKHFNQALNIVDEALQYVVNNEKLLSLKDRIIEEKAGFEKAEQERINKALQAAKMEEQHNLTKAVELTAINIKVDKYGDAYINGSVKNNGTETVHSIVIEFTVSDEKGKELESGKTNVFPNKLEPGETGDFEHVTYSTKENAKVNIMNISWLLEEKKG
ncbi:FxLYD domain-containing protein [Metabacillus sp. YM-086]|uniref:FxLYD domain-containing protein n=1 Tax=Metabacillus TaxID=2675233 RepID=UPI000EF574A8|nr:FxLYD domain-containing protein [Metabacillus litoralis]